MKNKTSNNDPLRIGDKSQWIFVNGDWIDGDDGLLTLSDSILGRDTDPRLDNMGIQSAHFAFYRPLCCSDFTASFSIKLYGHTDTGLVFRARDPRHFYLLHFPNCGQAFRAQHFWAVLSKMDDSGYLRIVKMEMLKRVPSNNGLALPVAVTVHGQRVICRVGDYGHFEVRDSTYTGPGSIGMYHFWPEAAQPAQIRNLRISAAEKFAPAWNETARQPRNWWHPLPTDQKVWQMPLDMRRFDDGELLLLVNQQIERSAAEDAVAVPYLTRSSDQGRTWSKAEPFAATAGKQLSAWTSLRLHLTPRGRLIAFAPDKADNFVWQSSDRGRNWTEAPKMNLHLGPPREKPTHNLSPNGLLNLADGRILAPMFAKVDAPSPAASIYTWGGGTFFQAFCMRSDDDGRTWSDPVNFDNPGTDAKGNQLEGNMDLTETSLVQLASGRVLALIRPVYSPWMWETWSDDGGETWSPCVRGPFPGYAAPNMVRTASGAVLMAHRLPELTVHCSMDDGRSWDAGTIIDSGLWAMGSMVEVEADKVLYIYWDSFEGLMRAQYIRVTPGGLEPLRP